MTDVNWTWNYDWSHIKFYTFTPMPMPTKGITIQSIKKLLGIYGGYRTIDKFLIMSKDNHHIYITLVIDNKDWHFKHIIYNQVFRMLQNYLAITMRFSLTCRERLPSVEGMPGTFGRRFKSVLTV